MEVPLEIYVLYLIQFAFYLHSAHATVWLDPHRKDTGVMMCHHFVTLSLIGISYGSRYGLPRSGRGPWPVGG